MAADRGLRHRHCAFREGVPLSAPQPNSSREEFRAERASRQLPTLGVSSLDQLAGGATSKRHRRPFQFQSSAPKQPPCHKRGGRRQDADAIPKRPAVAFTPDLRGAYPVENSLNDYPDPLGLPAVAARAGEHVDHCCLVTVSHAFEESGERTSWVTELAARVTGAVN